MSSVYNGNKTKGNFSVEDSGPPSPTSGTVLNFGEVAPGIYRSSFPMNGNFEHLRSLGLKTILTLVPQEYPAENVLFMKENGINHFQIPIPAHKNESITIPLENVANALDILHDTEKHPVLVHCNKGKVSSYFTSLHPHLPVITLHNPVHENRGVKHRTGCIIATYRLLSHWSPAATITEYRKYAGSKARPLDESFIYSFDVPGMMALLKSSSSNVKAGGGATADRGFAGMLPTPPASEKDGDCDHRPDDAWTLHIGI
ncbi:MAG: hypothetical protein Q9198_004353 [Flavoplaca austrocitrina]